ncbi:SAM-dependent methyltransferase, partial [Methylobacterium sp. P5_C11]
SIIPDHLRTCDITRPFILRDQRTDNPAQFDIISMWEVLEHIPESDLPQLFENVRTHLSNDGIFVGSIATYDDIVDGVSYHPTVKPEMWWRNVVQNYGLKFVPPTMFSFKDYCRGSGNPNTWADPDFSKNPEAGFHFVMKHISA